MMLSVLAPVTRMTARTAPDARPIEMACITSHAMCEPELISRCQVPLGRAAELVDTLVEGHDVAVVLDGRDAAPRVVEAQGFPAAWTRYNLMLAEQRGRAIRWFVVPQPPPVARTTERR
jgi:hypothetical protein